MVYNVVGSGAGVTPRAKTDFAALKSVLSYDGRS